MLKIKQCQAKLHPVNGECVILLHGLARTKFSMKRLELKFKQAGYHVINKSYPSRKYNMEDLIILKMSKTQ